MSMHSKTGAFRSESYIGDEVIIKTRTEIPSEQFEQSPPHYKKAAQLELLGALATDDNPIRKIIADLGYPEPFFSYLFVPARDVKEASVDAMGLSEITARYDKQEQEGGSSRTYKIRFEKPVDVRELCRHLQAAEQDCEQAYLNYLFFSCRAPNDELYRLDLQWNIKKINCEKGWDVETGHEKVVIAIIDTGIHFEHPELQPKLLLPGYDSVNFTSPKYEKYKLSGDFEGRDNVPRDEHGHGTHCAGIAAAATNTDGEGMAGVCWGGRILPVRAFCEASDINGHVTAIGTSADIAAAIDFAVKQGAHVLNFSFAGVVDPEQADLVKEEVKKAYKSGVCMIAATGNEDQEEPCFPASYPNVLAVGAVNYNLSRWAPTAGAMGSNYGPNFDPYVMAPGVRIRSTDLNHVHMKRTGTSMATPFVTGLAALVVSCARRFKVLPDGPGFVDQVYDLICNNTQDNTGGGKRGKGVIDMGKTLEAAKRHFNPNP